MSVLTAESILALVNQLPAMERTKLIEELNHQRENQYVVPEGRIISTNAPYIDRTLEFQWMKEHEREYAGQWIALMGDKLVASGPVAKDVFAKARELGYPRAMVVFVEDLIAPYISL